MANNFGIDLGTSEVKIFSQKSGKTVIEKNMVAIRNGDQLLAVGNDAFEMYEKNPPSIEVSGTVREGALDDIDKVEALLHILLERAEPHIGMNPGLYFSAPLARSALEERAYYAISRAGDLRNPRVYLIDRPICDAIALGIPLSRTEGSMIVNIGAQNTDISVIASEQVIITKTIAIGGQQMNEAICDLVRRRLNMLIGHRTARRLKAVMTHFGNAKKEARRVYGLDTLSGLPREVVVPSTLINEAVTELMSQLAREIREFIERTPPQIERSVRAEGIYLTGGSTRMPDIELFFRKACGTEINLSSYYDLCTIRGIEELITHKPLHKWAQPVKDKT